MKKNSVEVVFSVTFQLGKRIRYLRKRLKISQEELSFRSNLSKNYISDVERGTRNPTLTVLEKIAQGLDVSLSELFSGIGSL